MVRKTGSRYNSIVAEVILDIVEALRSASLQGDGSLQEVVAAVFEKHQSQLPIMPQTTSTLNSLVNFPLNNTVEADPTLKLNNAKVANKIIKFDSTNNASASNALVQRDSVCYFSGQSNVCQERTMSRMAQSYVTSHPDRLILMFCIQEHLASLINMGNFTAEDILKLFLVNSPEILADLDNKLNNNSVTIFLTKVKLSNYAYKYIYKLVIDQLCTLNVPLFISADKKDLKIVRSFVSNKSESFVQIMPLNRSAVTQIIKTKLDWDAKKCNDVLDSMFSLLSDSSNHPIFYHLVLVEKVSKFPFNLFAFFAAYVSSVVRLYMTKEEIVDRKHETSVYNTLTQYAIQQYESSGLTVEQNVLKKIPQFFVSSDKLEFLNDNLVDYLVTLSLLFKRSPSGARKISIGCREILSEPRFRQVRRFLDSYFEQEDRHLVVSISRDMLKNEICNCADEELLKVFCEEGLYHLFKVAKIKLTLEMDDWLKNSSDECLSLACFSNENLVLALINLGADLLQVLEKKRDHGLLHSVAARGDCILMQLIIREMRNSREMELFLGKPSTSSQKDDFSSDPEVEKFLQDMLNARGKLGYAPLHSAAEHDKSDMAQLLLTHGADVTLLDNPSNRWTPLHYAVFNGNRSTTNVILKAIEANWGDRKVPLEGAIRLGLDLMLEKGTDAVSRPRDEWMEAQKCSLHDYQDVLAFVVKHRQQVVDDVLKGRSVAFTAVAKGFLNVLRILLDCGERKDVTDVEKSTLLHVAAESGYVEIVRFLGRTCVDQQNNLKETALDIAASNGRFEVIDELLEQGAVASFSALSRAALRVDRRCCERLLEADAQQSSPAGWTVLHVAAQASSVSALKLMVELRADPDVADNEGRTPLHVAASKSDGKPCVEYLLTLGVNINRLSIKGLTPLQIAVSYNYSVIAQLLLDHGADPNLSDPSRQVGEFGKGDHEGSGQLNEPNEALDFLQHHIGTSSPDEKFLSFLSADIEDLEEESKSKVASSTHDALHDAVLNSNVVEVRCLLEKGADVNFNERKDKCTPLHIAVSMNCVDVVSELLAAKNVNVDARDVNDETPLHIAARNGFVEIGKMLVDNGANLKASNNQRKQPLLVALEKNHTEFVNFVLDSGVIFKASTSTGDVALEMKKTLAMAERINFFVCGPIGMTPCQHAAAEGNLENIKILLNEDASALYERYDDGNTLLHLAALGGHIDVVKLLVKKGIDPRSLNNQNKTALEVTNNDACKAFLRDVIE